MDCMKELFAKTFSELTTQEPLDIRGLGETPLTPFQLSALYAVVDYRYENLLPTTMHTDKKPFELCKAIESPGYETLAYAIVGRLWEMGVERSRRTFANTYKVMGFNARMAVARGAL